MKKPSIPSIASGKPLMVFLLASLIAASLVLASAAERINEKTALTMFGTYASLRVINAALSTAQEAEFSASAAVVGGSAKPMKVLEPLDDFIEQMASIVLWVAIVSGILSVGLWPVVIFGSLLLSLAAAMRWFLQSKDWSSSLSRALLWPGLFLALVIPATFVFSPLVADLATQNKWEEAVSTLSAFEAKSEELVDQQDVSEAGETGQIGSKSFFSGLIDFSSSVTETFDEGISRTGKVVSAGLDYVQNADDLVGAVLAIGSIVLLKLFVLPIVSMIVCLSVLRHALQNWSGRV